MKYLRYVSIIIFAIIRKVVGLVWFYPASLFRRYARNTVYNYVLENNIWLKRLNERNVSNLNYVNYNGIRVYGYLIAPGHNTNGGYIKYRKVSKLEYELVFWFIWGWLDDDSNYDTYSNSQDEKFTKYCKFKQYGNSFDKGDALEPEWCCIATTAWLWRNTAYNFRYSLHECIDPKKTFYFQLFNRWHFGFMPKESSHYGRMVYFTEYWDKRPQS